MLGNSVINPAGWCFIVQCLTMTAYALALHRLMLPTLPRVTARRILKKSKTKNRFGNEKRRVMNKEKTTLIE